MENALVEKIIDLSALQNNFEVVKKCVGQTTIMAILKADAYGHGMEKLALPSLENGATFLGVATIDEAIKLRKYLDNVNIERPDYKNKPTKNNPRLFCWIYDLHTCLVEAIEKNIDLSVSNLQQLEQIKRALNKINCEEKSNSVNKTQNAYIHLKVDTGMSRGGSKIEDFEQLLLEANSTLNIKIVGLWSHLASADDLHSQFTKEQIQVFEKAIKICEKNNTDIDYKHLAASAGLILHPQTHYDMVRPGIMLYGLSPNNEVTTPKNLGIKPIMSVKTSVLQIKKLPPLSKISYGGTYVLDKESHIGIVPIGYADGISRILSNKIYVEIKGKLYKQVGNICMDQFMIDLGENTDNISAGEKVTIIGEKVTADDLAKQAQTINYEIVSKINGRVKTIYVGGEQSAI